MKITFHNSCIYGSWDDGHSEYGPAASVGNENVRHNLNRDTAFLRCVYEYVDSNFVMT